MINAEKFNAAASAYTEMRAITFISLFLTSKSSSHSPAFAIKGY